MISRISPIICSHATAIPSDEGRVYSLVRTRLAPVPMIRFQKDTYSDFAADRFPKFAEPRLKQRSRDSFELYGNILALYGSVQSTIVRA